MPIPYKEQLLENEKVFRDPVHNYVHVQHQVILDLINSKEVQRLRRIKQLGTTSFTFHGGEHSRFSHSLGVYENARRIADIFVRKYPKEKLDENGWDDSERLVTLSAALLHDVGHGPYSHTFEHIFNTNHEQVTVDIITNPQTEIYQILNRVEEGFPEKVASVITKEYPNPQVVQMISSQVDADRMDYLLRDAYFTGTQYGQFDLTRILRVIRPYKGGIAFQANGMHAVEDYIVSRYQMYMQIYFHPVSRGMEVILDHLLKRAHKLYQSDSEYFERVSKRLVPFFKDHYSLEDYLRLDDGVLNTYFSEWSDYSDSILSDLANRFLNRHPFKSITFSDETRNQLAKMQEIIERVGYNPKYYTAINSSWDLPYDFYRPQATNQRTQIEIILQDGTLKELSTLSPLVQALAGQSQGDQRFYFPKEMIAPAKKQIDLFDESYQEFSSYIHNGELIKPE
ncbi:MAG: HD domain-containing protein [Lactobacillales bacterium]|jgi:HD superfamily phosphohydrolase|nr:HD domain-containing protein [Lactobacillales bacterium]